MVLLIAPASAQVKILKRKPKRIHLPVAHCTVLLCLVLREQFAEALSAIHPLIRIEFRDLKRRRRRRIVKNVGQRPRPTIDDPVVTHPTEHRLNSGVSKNAAPPPVGSAGLEGHFPQLTSMHGTSVVVHRQDVVHHCPVAGDQFPGGSVACEKLGHVLHRLLLHGRLEMSPEAKVLHLKMRHREGDRLIHVQPLPHKGLKERIAP